MESQDLPLQVLREVFNYQEFRLNQREIIENVLQGKHTLAIMPTGAGKSLCFQIPALIFPGLTLVISPLIALMKDQVDTLKKKGIQGAFFLNSSLNESEQSEIYEQLKRKEIKLLYLAPETLLNTKLIHLLQETSLSLIAIDEAHCISTWGHDFRPDYLKIKEVLSELGNPPILALTATANRKVEEDILSQLPFHFTLFKDSFDRKNLLLSVLSLKPGQQKNMLVKEILEKVPGPAIIYVNFIKSTGSLCSFLQGQGFSCEYYHGGLDHYRRKEIQDQFIQGKTRIIVATNAFGMGIDKADIRLVIHYDVPKSIEGYYQETGRAGRDGNDSHCVLLYSQEDSIKLKKFIRLTLPEIERIEKLKEFFQKDLGKVVYFQQKRLAEALEIDEVTLKLLLHYFEKLGFIKIHHRVFRKALIKELHHPEEHVLFSSFYFQQHRNEWLNLEELGQMHELSLYQVNGLLQDLKSKKKANFIEGDFVNPVEVREELAKSNLRDVEDLFRKLMLNSAYKLRDVLEYISYMGCKKKFILNYFGESANLSCKVCNFCNPALLEVNQASKLALTLSEKDIELLQYHGEGEVGSRVKATLSILEGIRVLDLKNVRVGKHTLVDYLRGSQSKRVLQLPHDAQVYSSLKEFSGKELMSLIDYLLKEGYLTIIDADSAFPRPLLYLTEHGEQLLKEKKKMNLKMKS